MNMRDTTRQYLDSNHWHPCCQKTPGTLEGSTDTPSTATNQDEFLQFKCPRGHEYIAPEAFVIETPDILCNSGPLCIYCYANWLQVNLGAEEIV